jgi:hypothetical protein
MPTQRANLTAINDGSLAEAHVPLAGRNRPAAEPSSDRIPPHSDTTVLEMYPSLGTPPKEHLIPFSARIPVSMLDELTEVCDKHGIDKSSLVRDFIAEGLRRLKSAKRSK